MDGVEKEIHAIKKRASTHELGQLCRALFAHTHQLHALVSLTLSLPFFYQTNWLEVKQENCGIYFNKTKLMN